MSARHPPDVAKQIAAPRFIKPCLAKLAHAPPSGANWLHEIKYDGYRVQARIDSDGSVSFTTRNSLDWTGRFRALAGEFKKLKVRNTLIDGEVVVQDEKGASSFTRLVAELKAGRSEAMLFYAFDLLFLDGHDTRSLHLANRKELLVTLLSKLPKASRLRFSQHFEEDGASLLAEVCKLGLEGIISKRADLPYRSGRCGDWLKLKCILTDEFVIGGYTNSTAMKQAIGALLLGYFEHGAFVYAGRVGTGFSHATAHHLWRELQGLRRARSPYAQRLTADQVRNAYWVKPELVAQIEYRSRTADKLVRHATFRALRDDKPASEIGPPDV